MAVVAFPSDLVLLDELREHQNYEAWSAVSKTTQARPSPQILGFSNAGDTQSVVLADLRGKALAALSEPSSTLGIFEWSAPDGCDINDPDGWVAANPALGHLIPVEAIRSSLETDPEDVFRTEVLCQWVTAVDPAIPAAVWASLADADAGAWQDDRVRLGRCSRPVHQLDSGGLATLRWCFAGDAGRSSSWHGMGCQPA